MKLCACTKTDCLEGHCDCFTSGNVCSPLCVCTGCCNTHRYVHQELRHVAVQAALKRNPFCFYPPDAKPTKCKCRHSRCLAGYCACFENGAMCTDACQCTGCKNTSDESHAAARAKAFRYVSINNNTDKKRISGTGPMWSDTWRIKKRARMHTTVETVVSDVDACTSLDAAVDRAVTGMIDTTRHYFDMIAKENLVPAETLKSPRALTKYRMKKIGTVNQFAETEILSLLQRTTRSLLTISRSVTVTVPVSMSPPPPPPLQQQQQQPAVRIETKAVQTKSDRAVFAPRISYSAINTPCKGLVYKF